jgi:hypothetical protein
MADNKEIRISAKLDTNQFDTQLKSLEEKMKSLQKGNTQKLSSLGNLKDDPVFGPSAKKAYDEQQKSTTAYFQSLYKGQQEAFKNGEKYISQIKEQIKLEKEKVNLDKEKIKNLNDLMMKTEQGQRKTMAFASSFKNRLPEETMSQSYKPSSDFKQGPPDSRGRLNLATGAWEKTPIEAAGGGENSSQFAGIASILKGMGVAAILKGAMNATVKTIEHRIDRDTKMLSDKAGAATIAATTLHEAVSGKGGSQAYWASERQIASNMAMERQSNIGELDLAKGVGQGLLGGTAGMLAGGYAGMQAGGTLGAMFGPMGAIAGGAAGAMIGGGIGAFGGAAIPTLSDKRTYNRFFDSKAYSAMASKESMQNYQADLQAQKALNPSKAMGEENYYQNMGRYQQQARAMGLSSVEMLGKGNQSIKGIGATSAEDYIKDKNEGFLQKGLGVFSEETLNRNWQGMRSAGASSAMLREGRGTAATYERQFGLENAGALLGAQGAVGQGIGQSEQNLKKVLTDAVRGGVDLSKMPQELQKFTQVAVELATATGGFSQSAAAQLSASMYGPATTASIGAAKGAAEEFESKAGAGGGLEGQMNKAFVMKNFGGKINSGNLNILSTRTTAQLESDPQAASDVATNYFSGDEKAMWKFFKEKDAMAQNKTSKLDTAEKALSDYNSKKIEENTPELKATGAKIRGAAIEAYGQENDVSNMPYQTMMSKITGAGNALTGRKGGGEISDLVNFNLDRPGDKDYTAFEAMQGKGTRTAINAQADNQTTLTAAASSFSSNQALFNKSFDTFAQALKDGTEPLTRFNAAIGQVLGTLDANIKNLNNAPATNKVQTAVPAKK